MPHTLDAPAPAMASLLTDLSDEDIARLCHESRQPDAIQYGRCLKRISDDVISKFGWTVTADEAANQQYAHALSRDTSIKVPEVYRAF
ncbi:hypothetical protein N7471_006702 [Penicillium samsonianum]|uniref:uncharacterized protein n=1 Tax=Penicillium samsonianum TaxID=1882272 RepID=UPI002548828A|nr:uncharacterized protein N7471_006702 [Penicillium samsonianum]KAJ6140216.1 hypothetical protein N7471_006702 [Penicillium samsonianum]